jgi:hypothetical protein
VPSGQFLALDKNFSSLFLLILLRNLIFIYQLRTMDIVCPWPFSLEKRRKTTASVLSILLHQKELTYRKAKANESKSQPED